jgi:phage terminase large subunit-like protein
MILVWWRCRVVAECAARWASPRSRRRSSGRAVEVVARDLGLKLLPWQRSVLTVALEQARGRPAYRDVVVSVPRQSGKSSMALALLIWRMLQADQRILYSAQTRAAAREKLLNTWWPRLSRSALGERFTLHRGFGMETLSCDSGSVLQLVSTRESAGHGETVDLAVIDEAWVHTDAAVEQALKPAMATRRDAQLWVMSTAGTSRSTWWRAKLDAGRAAAEMGLDGGTACFDWSAADAANPADEATWWATMPALGRLIDAATVRADLTSMGLAEFRRAYLNQWPDAAAEGWRVFNRQAWTLAREDG